MASVWTAIPDSDIDPDSPFTTGLATAYRENVIAAFEGASGAPRSVEESVNEITAGSSYRYAYQPDETLTVNAAYTRVTDSIVVPRSGTYQIVFDLRRTNAISGIAYGRIYKNASVGYSGDAAIGTEQSQSANTWATKTETLTLNAGDVLSIYARHASATSAEVRNFRIESAVKQHG